MRYWIALLIAVLMIAGLATFAWVTIRQTEARIRAALRQRQEAGELSPALQGMDIDRADLSDFNMKLPSAEEGKLAFARAIASLWFIWAPVVVVLCISVAVLIGWLPKGKAH